MLQTTNFFMGSEIFRRHARMILQNDEKFTSFFITQTLIPDTVREFTVEEQYNKTLSNVKDALEFFDVSHVAVELQNNGNIHYHTIASIHKDKLNDKYQAFLKEKNKYFLSLTKGSRDRHLFYERFKEKYEIFDYVNEKYRFSLCKFKYFDAYNEKSPNATDIRSCYRGSSDLVSYMHKDIDRTYKICDKIKFTIYSKFILENLQRLVSFKHIQ